MRLLSPLVLLPLVLGCGHSGAAKLEGHWRGVRADGVAAESQAAANAFATQTELEVKGDSITVTTPHDRQSGAYRVVHEDKTSVTIVTDKDGPADAQTFAVDGDKLRWSVLEGKTIVFAREK